MKKSKENLTEIKVIAEIKVLEQQNYLTKQSLIYTKKHELVQLREQKMKGHYIRSCVQWIHKGERPIKCFCSLEKRRKDNTLISDQGQILLELKDFYSQLFQTHDNNLEELDLDLLLKDLKLDRLTHLQATSIEGEVKEEELITVLKNMKNNKTPGILLIF